MEVKFQSDNTPNLTAWSIVSYTGFMWPTVDMDLSMTRKNDFLDESITCICQRRDILRYISENVVLKTAVHSGWL